MARKERNEPGTPLGALIERAKVKVLRELVSRLANHSPEVRQECLEFLQQQIALPVQVRAEVEGDAALAIWEQLEPDLSKLNEYGGGPQEQEDRVANLLYQLSEKLRQSALAKDARCGLIDEVMPYILSRNSGMDDSLNEVLHLLCQDDEEWYGVAERLEGSKHQWNVDMARGIYRRLGDRDRYLRLRLRRMELGWDYYDLATFYWEHGEREQALAVARDGLKKATGRMNDLRTFVADRALESGNRQGYLELQFAQATDDLGVTNYKAFKDLCTPKEWVAYEPRMVAAIEKLRVESRMQLLMERGEFDQVVKLLSGMRYPDDRYSYSSGPLVEIAAKLETRYPKQVLAFYLTGLGSGEVVGTRQTYAIKAQIALKIRHLWVDILKTPAKWKAFARQLKTANQKRPAFQEAFTAVVPGWVQV